MAPTAGAGAQVPRRDLDPECEDLRARRQEAGPRGSSPVTPAGQHSVETGGGSVVGGKRIRGSDDQQEDTLPTP